MNGYVKWNVSVTSVLMTSRDITFLLSEVRNSS